MNTWIAVERLDDLDRVRADRQILHTRLGIHIEAVFVGRAPGTRALNLSAIEHQPADLLGAEHDVLGDVRPGTSMKC